MNLLCFLFGHKAAWGVRYKRVHDGTCKKGRCKVARKYVKTPSSKGHFVEVTIRYCERCGEEL